MSGGNGMVICDSIGKSQYEYNESLYFMNLRLGIYK